MCIPVGHAEVIECTCTVMGACCTRSLHAGHCHPFCWTRLLPRSMWGQSGEESSKAEESFNKPWWCNVRDWEWASAGCWSQVTSQTLPNRCSGDVHQWPCRAWGWLPAEDPSQGCLHKVLDSHYGNDLLCMCTWLMLICCISHKQQQHLHPLAATAAIPPHASISVTPNSPRISSLQLRRQSKLRCPPNRRWAMWWKMNITTRSTWKSWSGKILPLLNGILCSYQMACISSASCQPPLSIMSSISPHLAWSPALKPSAQTSTGSILHITPNPCSLCSIPLFPLPMHPHVGGRVGILSIEYNSPSTTCQNSRMGQTHDDPIWHRRHCHSCTLDTRKMCICSRGIQYLFGTIGFP